MSIQSIEIVSIPVSDQAESKRYYSQKLGFQELIDAQFDPSSNFRWVQLGPPEGGTSISLVNWDPNFQPGSVRELYLSVTDIQGTYDSLSQRGVSFSDQVMDTPFGKFAHFQDPDGNGWVLHEPTS